MEINNYLLAFGIRIQDLSDFKGWNDFIAHANQEAAKCKPKSTLASPAQKARYQAFLDKVKAIEAQVAHGASFSGFIEAQKAEMLEIQVEKTDEIKQMLRFCDAEKLQSDDFVKALCTEFAAFQITEDVIRKLIQAVQAEGTGNESNFSDCLSQQESKAVEDALRNTGHEGASLYEALEISDRSTVEELQKRASECCEAARKSNDNARSMLYGQCLKIFKTADAKQKYDNYRNLTKYEKINRNIEDPIRLTKTPRISEVIASKIITQAVKDYPKLSRAQAADYIKNYCAYRGYEVTIAAAEFVQVAPRQSVKTEGSAADKLIKNAEILLKQNELSERARAIFEEATKADPDNYLGWLGIARAITADFTLYEKSVQERAAEYIQCALFVAGSKKAEVEALWEKYLTGYANYRRKIQKQLDELYQAVADIEASKAAQQEAQKTQSQKVENLRQKMKYVNLKVSSLVAPIVWGAVVLGIAILFRMATLSDIEQFGLRDDIVLEVLVTAAIYAVSVFLMFVRPIWIVLQNKIARRNAKKLNAEFKVLQSIESAIADHESSIQTMNEKIRYNQNILNML